MDDVGWRNGSCGPEMKVRCDSENCCGQEHEWPEKTPCPNCGSIDDVVVWEAWGHPSGDLYCEECTGFNRLGIDRNAMLDYWTWHVEDGEPVIDKWERKNQRSVKVGS